MLTESSGCWDPGRKQTVKWAAEGARKGESLVWRNAWACVSCRGCVGIPQRARETVKQGGTANKNYSSLTDGIILSWAVFLFGGKAYVVQAMATPKENGKKSVNK